MLNQTQVDYANLECPNKIVVVLLVTRFIVPCVLGSVDERETGATFSVDVRLC